MQKKLYFGTNLKMYKNIPETLSYLQTLESLTKDISRQKIELFVIPSYTALERASTETDRRFIKLGSQNVHWEDEGPFTGEISPQMLKELNLDLIMIGHSERRHIFRETNFDINKKICSTLNYNFTSLLCIGETAEDKTFNVSAEVLRTQLKIGLHNVLPERTPNIWVAYEPVWSIGAKGTPASPVYAEKMHCIIKETLYELFGSSSLCIPVLYGGSVKPDNAKQLILQPSIDGLFIGRSAWQADDFNSLLREAKSAYEKQQVS